MENTIRSDMFGLSSTKHLRRNAVLHPGNDVVMMWWLCHLISRWGVGLNISDLIQRSGLIAPIASDLCQACQKYLCTVWSMISLWQGRAGMSRPNTCFAWAGGTFFSVVQFRVKLDTWYKLYHINLYVKPFQYSICIRSIWTKSNREVSFSFWLTLFYSISLS